MGQITRNKLQRNSNDNTKPCIQENPFETVKMVDNFFMPQYVYLLRPSDAFVSVNEAIFGSDNDLMPIRCKAKIWTSVGRWAIGNKFQGHLIKKNSLFCLCLSGVKTVSWLSVRFARYKIYQILITDTCITNSFTSHWSDPWMNWLDICL